jgi:hypothetical protein
LRLFRDGSKDYELKIVHVKKSIEREKQSVRFIDELPKGWVAR